MNNREQRSLEEIKAEILKSLEQMGVETKKIILFGSRARGDFSKSSDYDFLIITAKTFSIKEKREIAAGIRKVLVSFYIASDIIIKSEGEVEYFRNKIGSVVRQALKEGVAL
jgi:predicted nucleotidyltransferase